MEIRLKCLFHFLAFKFPSIGQLPAEPKLRKSHVSYIPLQLAATETISAMKAKRPMKPINVIIPEMISMSFTTGPRRQRDHIDDCV